MNWKRLSLHFVLTLLGGAIVFPIVTHAQVSVDLPSSFANLASQDVKTTIGNIVQIAIGFLGILLVLYLLYGGFIWMTSGGDEGKIEDAKKMIVAAVVGLVLVIASYAIATFIITNVQKAVGPGGTGDNGGPGPGPGACPTCSSACKPPSDGSIKICSVNPGTVGTGSSLTIVGYNFGTFDAASSKVSFVGTTTADGQMVQCNSQPQWTDNKIKVTVPQVGAGPYAVKVSNGAKTCTGTACGSVSISATPTPSINCLLPTAGAVGSSVTITGKNFGATKDAIEMEGSSGRFNLAASDIISWAADTIAIKVPAATPGPAISGDVRVSVGSTKSNGEYFSVTCSQNNQCASNCCSNNRCYQASVCAATNPTGPVIDRITPDNGEVGNFITITGRNFGSTSGTVHLSFNATDYQITTPPAAACSTVWWSDKQIIFAIPAAIGNGNNGNAPVTVQAGAAESSGINLAINDTVRPGLCSLSPSSGVRGDTVAIIGTNFNGATRSIDFGSIAGDSATFTSATQATVKVPNVQPASIGVTVTVGAQKSNPLAFTVVATGSQPRIESISPASGATSEYIHIYGSGFGSRLGTVKFIKGPDTYVGDVSFPPACQVGIWSDSHIVVKVPADALATPGAYEIAVAAINQSESNKVAFTKTAGTAGPGICLLNPSRGPVNTAVTVSGERLGSTAGTVNFFNAKPATSIGNWTNQQINQVKVPAGATSGRVTVTTSNNVVSGGIPFEVGACSNNNQCPSGSQCCGDGTCKTSCNVASGPQCTYVWTFTTGERPFGLDISQPGQCTAQGQSPSPYFNSTNAPVDTVISARFTAPIDFSSLGTGATASVQVRQCNTADTLDSATCGPIIGGTFSRWAGSKGFAFESAALLSANTWYEVELNSNSKFILAEDGSRFQGDASLVGNTKWYFRTRQSAQSLCRVSRSIVSPANQTIYLGTEGRYSSAGLDESSCTICRSASLQWSWSSSNASLATFSSTGNQLTVSADQNQTGNSTISATIANQLGVSAGQANLTVQAGDPFVTSFTPGSSCQAACTNSMVTASFNMPMNNATVLDASNVRLQQCSDFNCDSFSATAAVQLGYDAQTRTVRLMPTQPLAAGSWYRVTISGVKSVYDTSLSKLNYPPNSPSSYSWKFKTGSSNCTPDAVQIRPATAQVAPNQTANFAAYPVVNSIASCGSVNLNSANYNYDWSINPATVATLSNTGGASASAWAQQVGSATITASIQGSAATAGTAVLTVAGAGTTAGNRPPLTYTGHTPTNSPVCRNAQISASFSNRLLPLALATAQFFNVQCKVNNQVVACPPGVGRVQGNKVVYQFNDPKATWPGNAQVTVTINTGAQDIYFQTWTGSGQSWSFDTINDLCQTSYVTVDPPTYTFVTKNQSQDFLAQAYDKTGTPIAGATYEWTQKTGPIIQVPPLTGIDGAAQDNAISAKDKNGVDYAYVRAKGPNDADWKSGYARVAVEFCENPWTLQSGPYIDSEYDFAFNYCRDSIKPGSNDLPNLSAPVVRKGSGDLLKEHVFVVNLDRTAGGTVTVGDTAAAFESEPSTITSSVGSLVRFQIKAKDVDGDQFVLGPGSLPDGASFNPYSGVFVWSPTSAGTFNPSFILRQPPYADQIKTVTITVSATPGQSAAPQITMAIPSQGSSTQIQVGSDIDFAAITSDSSFQTYVWDFQDNGPTSNYQVLGSELRATHKFLQRGAHQVTVRVQGANGVWSQPAIVNVIVQGSTSFNWSSAHSLLGSLQQLFSTSVAWAQTATSGKSYDVVVVRVMKNLEHLTPLEWYRKYAPNPNGSPTATTVNGYPAIQDGTTTYVAAGNIYNGTVYTNIYLLSYNANAQESTKKLAQQIIKNWKFNYSQYQAGEDRDFSGGLSHCGATSDGTACTLDSDCSGQLKCPSILASLRRDVQRYTDIHSIARTLQEYAVSHKFCQNAPETACSSSSQCPRGGSCVGYYPSVASGSYVRGMSTSQWPSWQDAFRSTITRQPLPTDPINRFGDCGGASYDPTTCWDTTAQKFSCPANSPVYIYQVKGGSAYTLAASLETVARSVYSWPVENGNIKLTTSDICTGTPQGAFCGNGQVDQGEVCDGGFKLQCSVTSHNQATVGCKSDCSGWYDLSGWQCNGSCGDGQLDAPYEQCETNGSSLQGWSCTNGGTLSCGGQCQFRCSKGSAYVGQCGDGRVQLPEICDDGNQNGTYGHCNNSCTGYGDYCGDGVVSGTEECDTYAGLSNFSCANGAAVSCTSNCRHSCGLNIAVQGGACGNGIVDATNNEQCEPATYQQPSASVSSSLRQYACGETNARKHCSNDPTKVCNQDLECSGGTCQEVACQITGGWCGDGIKETPFETCDQGTGNTARCDNMTQSCSYCSTACRQLTLAKNYCGDGIINIGADSQIGTSDDLEKCDDGPNNGVNGFCDRSCQIPGTRQGSCGDGIAQWPWEICDEGTGTNGTPGHCAADCRGTVPLTTSCGNGQTEAGESCDDGPLNGQHNQCNSTCSGPTPAVCGNSFTEPAPYGNEQCDDGNVTNGDGCSSSCQTEGTSGGGAKMCGDNIVQKPNDAGVIEICDNGTNNGQAGKCWTDCTRLTNYCGDTKTTNPNDFGIAESCDQGPTNGTVVGGCNGSCTGTLTQICGDRKVTGTEQCDLCNSGNNYCNASGTQVNNCDQASCMIQPAGIACGNSVREGTEACDFGCPATFQHICFSSSADAIAGNGWCRDNCATNCGDGFWSAAFANPGDVCDQGYGVNGMAIGNCNAMCSGYVKYNCGDGVVTPSTAEVCDDGVANNGKPGYCGPGLTQPVEKNGVEEGCTSCTDVSCGDGKVSQSCNTAIASVGKEVCDPGNPATPNCNKWCSGVCGNKIKDPGEACDDPNGQNGQPGKCSINCTGQTKYCGDGTKDSPNDSGQYEFCDSGVNNGRSGYCNTTCTATLAAVCHDGITSPGEACDYEGFTALRSCNTGYSIQSGGVQGNYCNNCQFENISSCVAYGLNIKGQYGIVGYINNKLVLANACSENIDGGNPGITDSQGLTYPDASVVDPVGINACSDKHNIPYTNATVNLGTGIIRGYNSINSGNEVIGKNVVAFKAESNASDANSLRAVVASFISKRNTAVYSLAPGPANSWKCVSEDSPLIAAQGTLQWWDVNFDDSSWGLPKVWSGAADTMCQVQAGYNAQYLSATNPWVWADGSAGQCKNMQTLFCRLTYWGN